MHGSKVLFSAIYAVCMLGSSVSAETLQSVANELLMSGTTPTMIACSISQRGELGSGKFGLGSTCDEAPSKRPLRFAAGADGGTSNAWSRPPFGKNAVFGQNRHFGRAGQFGQIRAFGQNKVFGTTR